MLEFLSFFTYSFQHKMVTIGKWVSSFLSLKEYTFIYFLHVLRKDESSVDVFKEEMDCTGKIRQDSIPHILTIPET